jgi:hypothetical protein
MGSKPLVAEEKIEETIRKLPKDAFTVLEFIDIFKQSYPNCWKMLVDRFGLFGSKRKYTVSTYLSNRLDVYSHKPHSILVPFTRWSEGGFQDRRRTTKEEQKVFGSPWIAVYKKKGETRPRQISAAFGLLSSLPVALPSYPRFWSRKSRARTTALLTIRITFRETYTTVSWFAYCRLERHCGHFTTIRAFDLKHLSVGHEKSPLLALD